MDFKKKIRNIPDFPQKGVVFRDIAPLLEDKRLFRAAIEALARKFRKKRLDKIVGIDARGFVLAGALAQRLKTGLVMIRKKGKLPYKTKRVEYNLEYGKAVLEIHQDSIEAGERILIVDDVLATGGTMRAAIKLVEGLRGKIIGLTFLIVLDYLSGREKLKKYRLFSLVNYSK